MRSNRTFFGGSEPQAPAASSASTVGPADLLVMGDSLSDNDLGIVSTHTPSSQGTLTYGLRLSAMTNGALRYVGNAALGGDTTSDMLSKIPGAVEEFLPNGGVCVFTIGGNDIFTGVPTETLRERYLQIVDALQNRNVLPVLVGLPPNDNTDVLEDFVQHNLWLANVARSRQLIYVDIYSPMVDPTDGTFLATMTDDGTHQSELGGRVIARAIADAVEPLLGSGAPSLNLVSSANDPTDILNSTGGIGLFTQTPVGGVAGGWDAAVAGTGFTPTVETPTASDGILGNWQRITAGGAGNGIYAVATGYTSTGYSPGDRIEFSFAVQTDETFNGILQAYVYMVGAGGTQVQHWLITNRGGTDGEVLRFRDVFEVLPGTTGLYTILGVADDGDGTGYAQFAQVSQRNLTVLGL